VRAIITGKLSQAGRGADPHMPEPISMPLSAYATPSIAAAATGSAPSCDTLFMGAVLIENP
jgi:hypothetical protein